MNGGTSSVPILICAMKLEAAAMPLNLWTGVIAGCDHCISGSLVDRVQNRYCGECHSEGCGSTQCAWQEDVTKKQSKQTDL